MKTIYLANSYGFSEQEKITVLPKIVKKLNELGLTVVEPFSRTNTISKNMKGWAHKVGKINLQEITNAEGFFAVVNGCPPDEGVMIELGIAIALNKHIFLFRDDFRRCSDSEEYPLNLMAFIGFPEFGWQNYYYTFLEELSDPNKALAHMSKINSDEKQLTLFE